MLIRWLVNAVALLILGYLFSGVSVENAFAALLAAFLLGVVHLFVRPFLLVLALPINLITLGLFTFVVNALLLLLIAKLVPGFALSGFWMAVLAAFLLSMMSGFMMRLMPSRG